MTKATTPANKIHPDLAHLAVPLDQLDALPANPHKGDVEAIMASYAEFGQVKPIVGRRKDDGRIEIVAGNHQTEGARRLGWDAIAVLVEDWDATRGLAFAITENRTQELGTDDDDLLYDALGVVIEDYGELLDDLGWDEFELAVLDSHSGGGHDDDVRGYIAPVIINPPGDTSSPSPSPSPTSLSGHAPVAPVTETDADGEVRLRAPESVDERTAVTAGSTAVGAAGTTRAVIQYTLTFDDYEQQQRWYRFMRWLRAAPAYVGETNVERLLDFIDAHAEVT